MPSSRLRRRKYQIRVAVALAIRPELLSRPPTAGRLPGALLGGRHRCPALQPRLGDRGAVVREGDRARPPWLPGSSAPPLWVRRLPQVSSFAPLPAPASLATRVGAELPPTVRRQSPTDVGVRPGNAALP